MIILEIKNDGIMGAILTENEKNKQASNINVTSDLMKGLLGKEKIDLYDFGTKHMYLKYYDNEEIKEIQEKLSEKEKSEFPSMGLDMGVFKNNQNKYISVYDVGDIRTKVTEIAGKELFERAENLMRGNIEIKDSKNAIDNLTVHFRWSEKFSQEDISFKGKEGLEFINKLIETDNVYSNERNKNNLQNSIEGYLPYYKTRMSLQYSGINYDIERIDIGDGIIKNFESFVDDRKESFGYISKEIEKLKELIPEKVITDFKENYEKLFQEMKNYEPSMKEFKTSEEGFNELEKVLLEKEISNKKDKSEKETKDNPWKKHQNKVQDIER